MVMGAGSRPIQLGGRGVTDMRQGRKREAHSYCFRSLFPISIISHHGREGESLPISHFLLREGEDCGIFDCIPIGTEITHIPQEDSGQVQSSSIEEEEVFRTAQGNAKVSKLEKGAGQGATEGQFVPSYPLGQIR